MCLHVFCCGMRLVVTGITSTLDLSHVPIHTHTLLCHFNELATCALPVILVFFWTGSKSSSDSTYRRPPVVYICMFSFHDPSSYS